MNDEEIDIEMSSKSDKDIELSGISFMIDDIYIKGMTNKEIIKKLKEEYDIPVQPFLRDNREYLEKKIHNEIMKTFNVKKSSK